MICELLRECVCVCVFWRFLPRCSAIQFLCRFRPYTYKPNYRYTLGYCIQSCTRTTEIERKTTTIIQKNHAHTHTHSKKIETMPSITTHKFRIKRYNIGSRGNTELKLTSKQENVVTTMEQERYNDNSSSAVH